MASDVCELIFFDAFNKTLSKTLVAAFFYLFSRCEAPLPGKKKQKKEKRRFLTISISVGCGETSQYVSGGRSH